MNQRNKILLLSAISLSGLSMAQQSQFFADKEQYRFNLAENLYQNKIYAASQYEFSRQYFFNQNLENSKKETARFFSNVIGVILAQNHAENGLDAFIKDYPKSALFAQANLPLADYYLAKKDFPKALETLQKVNQYQLDKQENTQYILKLGYAKFMTGDSNGAIDALEEAYKNAEDKGDIAYMLGHLYYANQQNEKAFQFFDEIKNNEKYAKLVKPYYVQLYFNEKDYEKAIVEGNDLLQEDISADYKAEVHKIIGESYFMQKQYTEAYPHLKAYLQTQQNPSESDLYEMGFVAANLQKFDEAISYYNQLVNSNSAFSQNAYYQLGNAYLEVGKKQEALSAFRSAKEMTYDKNVSKLAHEQYAKLSYDIGNPFESPQLAIKSYLEKYGYSKELEQLLVKSYLFSGDYKGTIKAIEELTGVDAQTEKIYQEVLFLYGTELFNKVELDAAEQNFKKSLKYNLNKTFNLRAQYWLAQTYYQKGDYATAIYGFEKLDRNVEEFPEKQQLSYDLGYAHFKSKNFAKAKEYFKEYLKNPKPEFKSDAELRLADTYYAGNELNEAIAIYNKTEGANDYTQFQKAMAIGFKGDTEAKIVELKKLISNYKNSEYQDDAYYELGTSYASIDQFQNSSDAFSQVIKIGADKDLVANAEIYRAQNYEDLNQPEKALAELKALGNKYKNTAYAEKIVAAAKPIYLKNGDASGYEYFAKNMGVNIAQTDLDEINLSLAQSQFAKKEYAKAIPNYEKFLTQNPTGEKFYQAQYELGESYYQTKNFTKAKLVLGEIANAQNDYQEDAQVRIAQILLSENNSSEAKIYLENLVNSSNVTIKNFASIELMKIYAEEKNFSQAEKFANEVLKYSKNSAAVLEQAKVIKSRSLMNQGKDKDAQTAYAALEKSANTEVAAEALYAKAFYQNKGKAFKSSNETIFKLANNYASEEFWGAKALVLMARNYLALKDNYQASYTCDQIIENYQDFPEIVSEAKEVKKLIK